jgi:hypothetical protein
MIPRTSSVSAAAAPSPPAWQSASSSDGMFPGPGSSGQQQLAISNGVLLAAVIFLFMVVVFVFLLYLYAKRYLGANPLLAPSSPSSRFLFVAASPLPQRGLPASVLQSLPVTVYGSPGGKDKDALECAVCLSEVGDGEKVRTLPKCSHGFHVECIDMWFHSHDTCPLCRAPVGDLDALPREEPSGAPLELPVFPTNVLFWGTHDEVTNAGLVAPPRAAPSASSSASGRRKENLVIDIPTRAVATTTTTPPPANSPLPASRMPGSADEMRSPVSARLRSLRRLLSRGKQAMVGTSSSYSPRDIEQGLAGGEAAAAATARPPKTPKTPPSAHAH